jgi:hypothetical protein
VRLRGYLMQHLLESSGLRDLGLKPSYHGLEEQAELVCADQLDLAVFVARRLELGDIQWCR